MNCFVSLTAILLAVMWMTARLPSNALITEPRRPHPGGETLLQECTNSRTANWLANGRQTLSKHRRLNLLTESVALWKTTARESGPDIRGGV